MPMPLLKSYSNSPSSSPRLCSTHWLKFIRATLLWYEVALVEVPRVQSLLLPFAVARVLPVGKVPELNHEIKVKVLLIQGLRLEQPVVDHPHAFPGPSAAFGGCLCSRDARS